MKKLRSRCFVDGKLVAEAFFGDGDAETAGRDQARLCAEANNRGIPWRMVVDDPDDNQIYASWDSGDGAAAIQALLEVSPPVAWRVEVNPN